MDDEMEEEQEGQREGEDVQILIHNRDVLNSVILAWCG